MGGSYTRSGRGRCVWATWFRRRRRRSKERTYPVLHRTSSSLGSHLLTRGHSCTCTHGGRSGGIRIQSSVLVIPRLSEPQPEPLTGNPTTRLEKGNRKRGYVLPLHPTDNIPPTGTHTPRKPTPGTHFQEHLYPTEPPLGTHSPGTLTSQGHPPQEYTHNLLGTHNSPGTPQDTHTTPQRPTTS